MDNFRSKYLRDIVYDLSSIGSFLSSYKQFLDKGEFDKCEVSSIYEACSKLRILADILQTFVPNINLK